MNALILKLATLGAGEQLQQFEAVLDKHQQGTEQRDDISFFGLRI